MGILYVVCCQESKYFNVLCNNFSFGKPSNVLQISPWLCC